MEMSLNPVVVDLAAELDSLRSLRRRSLSQPQEAFIDPDLPPDSTSAKATSPPTSPTSSSDSDVPLSALTDLFWLPARLHPEIAPQEFKDFIREQTRPENIARRTSLGNGYGSVSRRRSMLSRPYNPANDDAAATDVLQRRQSNRNNLSALENLTIADLHQLEQSAQESNSDSVNKQQLQGLLQRSMSFGNDLADSASYNESDSPLIVPAPGSILRRSARTKVRKSSLLGDGNGHRFPATRRNRIASTDSTAAESASSSSPDKDDLGAESEVAADAGDSVEEIRPAYRPSSTPSKSVPSLSLVTQDLPDIDGDLQSANSQHSRSMSSDSFLDAYMVSHSPDTMKRASWTSAPSTSVSQQQPTSPIRRPSPGLEESRPTSPLLDYAGRAGQHKSSRSTSDLPATQGLGITHVENARPTTKTASATRLPPQFLPSTRMELAVLPHIHPQAQVPGYPQQRSPLPIPIPSPTSLIEPIETRETLPAKNDKAEKKSTWARLGLAKSGKAEEHEDESSPKKSKKKRPSAIDTVEKSQDAQKVAENSFFASIFAKKKQEEEMQAANTFISPTASGVLSDDGSYFNFYRLPIHVERAIYRLSHIKLANPRRALYEQVLISNLMFWYLSQQAASFPRTASRVPPQQQQQQQQQPPLNDSIASYGHQQANEMYIPMPLQTQDVAIQSKPPTPPAVNRSEPSWFDGTSGMPRSVPMPLANGTHSQPNHAGKISNQSLEAFQSRPHSENAGSTNIAGKQTTQPATKASIQHKQAQQRHTSAGSGRRSRSSNDAD